MSRRYAGANQPTLKRNNAAVIFRVIHELGPIARVDLAQHTGLNPGTVSHIVDVLVERGVANETGYRSSPGAGRKAVELVVNTSSRLAIGIDLARREFTAALVDLSGQVVERLVEPAPRPWHTETAVQLARRMVDMLRATLSASDNDRVVGVGMVHDAPLSVQPPLRCASSSRRPLIPRERQVWQHESAEFLYIDYGGANPA